MKKMVVSSLMVVMSAGLLSACGPSEADKIGDAQLCLDAAAPGQAAACLEKISGVESKAASTLRCSAGFIDEGFTQPTRFNSAFDQLSNSGSSGTEAFLSVLSFKSQSTLDLNVTMATDTYGHCVKSGGKGVTLLASMANTATNLAKVAGTLNPNTTDIESAITDLLADPSSVTNAPIVAAVGGAISTTYTASCQTGQQADPTLCSQLDTALAGIDLTDSAAIGQAALNYWKNN